MRQISMHNTMHRRGATTFSRQEVLDASLRLQVVRARFCDDLLARRPCDAEVFVVSDRFALRDWLEEHCGRAGELTAVTWTRHQTVESFAPSDRCNRELVESGVRMTSFFDISEGSPTVTDFIVAADDMPYHVAFGPIQLKLLDGERVIVEGPVLDDRRSLMMIHGTEAVNAAKQYLQAVRRGAVRAAELRQHYTAGLTPRQHVIAALLGDGCTDEDIAERLTLSVRTVRYEVAKLMDVLEVKTRFAAGVRYAEADTPDRHQIAGTCNAIDHCGGMHAR
ncbi:LuxR C-terminal-related transcriptional regulator [Kribbella sp. NPDC058245]|uniref:helix-turn-helix transcriptional regulator n=1 Tax=Kribbella sp. NPDC058245 TaxID=3346399 RepID=UPI0036E8D256